MHESSPSILARTPLSCSSDEQMLRRGACDLGSQDTQEGIGSTQSIGRGL